MKGCSNLFYCGLFISREKGWNKKIPYWPSTVAGSSWLWCQDFGGGHLLRKRGPPWAESEEGCGEVRGPGIRQWPAHPARGRHSSSKSCRNEWLTHQPITNNAGKAFTLLPGSGWWAVTVGVVRNPFCGHPCLSTQMFSPSQTTALPLKESPSLVSHLYSEGSGT